MLAQHTLGSTDIKLSRLGLGTVKFGRNSQVKYPQAFALPDDQAILTLLARAKALGVNFLDTAPAYGSSEERLGNALKGDRHAWILGSKVGENFINGESHYDFTPEHTRESIERSLKRLQTDYLDIVLVHSNGEDETIIRSFGILDVLAEIKKSGLIRAFGMSTKTVAGGLLAVEQSDLVMVTYNPIHTEERPVIEHAFQQQKGILIKKALASGHLQKIANKNPLDHTLSFICQEPGVSSIVIGTLNPTHLAQSAEIIERFDKAPGTSSTNLGTK